MQRNLHYNKNGDELIIGIDPGPKESHIVEIDLAPSIITNFSATNERAIEFLLASSGKVLCLERIEARGYSVAQSTFDTVEWVGRFYQAYQGEKHRYFRRMIKLHFTGKSNTKDSHIRQVLIDRYGDKGTKSSPGFFYGVSSHRWQAAAVALYHYETTTKQVFPK